MRLLPAWRTGLAQAEKLATGGLPSERQERLRENTETLPPMNGRK
jgi:hypothetical protein